VCWNLWPKELQRFSSVHLPLVVLQRMYYNLGYLAEGARTRGERHGGGGSSTDCLLIYSRTADLTTQAIMGQYVSSSLDETYTPCPFCEATMPALEEPKAPKAPEIPWKPTPEEIADAEARWQERLRNPQPPTRVPPICTVW